MRKIYTLYNNNKMNYKTLLFIDTETTGRGPDDRIIQIAYSIGEFVENQFRFIGRLLLPVTSDELVSIEGDPDNLLIYKQLFNSEKEIDIEAMAVHRITPEKLIGKQAFVDSDHFKILKEFSNRDDVVLIAHNAPFDLEYLEKEGLKFPKFIDTLRVARHLIPDKKSHSLQYLIYEMGLYKEMPEKYTQAHDAAGDVFSLIKLFMALDYALFLKETLGVDERVVRFLELTLSPVTYTKINFGKYSGKTLAEIKAIDSGYLNWLKNNTQDTDLIHSINQLN